MKSIFENVVEMPTPFKQNTEEGKDHLRGIKFEQIAENYCRTKKFLKSLASFKKELDEVNNSEHKVDRRKTYYCLVDVETIGADSKICYDISWIIINSKGETVLARGYVVREVFCFMELMSKAYYFKKFAKYSELLAMGIYQLRDLDTIISQMNEDMQKYAVSVFTAYNSRFDISALNMTLEELHCQTKLEYPEEIECVWNRAVNTFMQDDDYRKFCLEHGLVSGSKKYWQTSAEACYKYLKKDGDIEEEHMGLFDCFMHEREILKACLQSKKRLKKEDKVPSATPWRKLKLTDKEYEQIQQYLVANDL